VGIALAVTQQVEIEDAKVKKASNAASRR